MKAILRTNENPENFPITCEDMDFSVDRTPLQAMDRFRRYEEVIYRNTLKKLSLSFKCIRNSLIHQK